MIFLNIVYKYRYIHVHICIYIYILNLLCLDLILICANISVAPQLHPRGLATQSEAIEAEILRAWEGHEVRIFGSITNEFHDIYGKQSL